MIMVWRWVAADGPFGLFHAGEPAYLILLAV